MSDERKAQYLKEAAELLERQDAEAKAEGEKPPEAPPVVRLPPEIAPAFLLIDLGVHVLTGIQSQFQFLKRQDLATAMQAFINGLCGMRDRLLKSATGGLIIAQPGDLPRRG